jgi:2-polyprenyl-6-methoxyphenol hydroxylase-like FAD-dependent oxidoreductase
MQQDTAAQQGTFDVVVVGAGPVGMLLASELALGGASVQVLERTTKASDTIKAGSINIASAEILARRGLLGKAREAHHRGVEQLARLMAHSSGVAPEQVFEVASRKAVRAGHFAAIPLDNEKLNTDDPDIAGHNEVVDATLVVQREVEALLCDHAASLGVPIRRGVEVTGVEQTEERVTVRTDAGDLFARYVVGCDGGRSIVRRSLGFEFPGSDPEITGRQAVVDLDDVSKLKFGWNWSTRGVYRYGPLPGIILTVEFQGPPADRTSEVTAAEIEASLQRTSGTDVKVTKMHGQATRWTDNARQASVYRKGRVLLAGDAAHVHSPFSGQGLNLGLGDATNLGWKLAATVRGWAPEGLLDTYQAERHPLGEEVLEWTRGQVALMRPDPKVGPLRRVVADLMGTRDGMTAIVNRISGVMQRVELPHGHEPASHFLLGRLVPDITLAGAESIRSAFPAGRFVLLDRSADAVFLAAAAPWQERTIFLHDRSTSQSEGISAMLVRPDGVIVWLSRTDEQASPEALRTALRTWAGNPAECL